MPNNVIIRGAGTPVGGGVGGGGGLPGGAGVAPSSVTAITVTGYLDPNALEIYLQISFTPPGSGTYSGVHLWLDIPDHGDGSNAMVLGSTTVGNGKTVAGPFNPIDLGVYTNPPQPWNLQLPFPSYLGLNPDLNIPCRLYIASISTVTDNLLVQDGLSNATPNAAFTLVSEASGSPTAGTNITANCGEINVLVLSNDNSTGKLMTPFLAEMSSVPSNPPKGWGYRLYISYGNADPTVPANLTPVTDVQTEAGIIPASKTDAVTDVLNSFSIVTPTSTVKAFIWAIAGLTVNGVFTPNNVVGSITNQCPVSFGSNTGVTDASQVLQASISSRLAVILSQLDIMPSSLNAATYLEAGTIVGGLLAATNIITGSAQIGTAVIAYSSIASCSVGSLIAGTAVFTSTATFENGFNQLIIASGGVEITNGSYLVEITSSSVELQSPAATCSLTGSGLSMSAGSYSMTLTSSSLQLSAGSNYLTLTSSELLLSYGGSTSSNYPNVAVFSSSAYISASSTEYVEITASGINIATGSFLHTLVGASLTTFHVFCTDMQAFGQVTYTGLLATGASAGSAATVPSVCAGYVKLAIVGVSGYVGVPYFPV